MSTLLAMWVPSTAELCIVGVIAFLLFGRKLPEYARAIGSSVWELKDGLKKGFDDSEREDPAA
jgi:TatA/E family protein of Tat protein translocase